jgi:hypothetical protein
MARKNRKGSITQQAKGYEMRNREWTESGRKAERR